MSNLPLFEKQKDFASYFDPTADIILYNGDTNELIDNIPDNYVKLIIQ